jgi:hypothetical protein
MKKIMLTVAKGMAGIGIAALMAGHWVLMTGSVAALDQQARLAAQNSNILEFAAYAGLHFLLMIGMPLVFGAVGICVLAAYHAFTKMQSRQSTDNSNKKVVPMKSVIATTSIMALAVSVAGCNKGQEVYKDYKEGKENNHRMSGVDREAPRVVIEPDTPNKQKSASK